MFTITKKIILAASVVALYSGQFNACATTNSNNDLVETEGSFKTANESDDLGLLPIEIEDEAGSLISHASQLGLQQSDSAESKFFVHDQFLPGLPQEIKIYVASYTLLAEDKQLSSSPFLLAQLCRSWCGFILDFVPNLNNKLDISNMTKSALSNPQSLLYKWLARKDMLKLKAGIFRFQPAGADAIEVPLAEMYLGDANGELALPVAVAPYLCVTPSVETFVKPVAPITEKTLILLLTLSKLKGVAQQISTDAVFLKDVAQTDPSTGPVCALVRYGGHTIAKWGFRFTILKFSEMNNLSLWQLITHKNARWRDGGASARGAHSAELLRWRGEGFFLFLNRS